MAATKSVMEQALFYHALLAHMAGNTALRGKLASLGERLQQVLEAPIDTAVIENYMSTRLYTAPDETPILKLQEMFLGLFIRHILITRRRKTIGLLSIGDGMRAGLLEKDMQIKDLTAMASWEYYENWGWDRKLKPPKK